MDAIRERAIKSGWIHRPPGGRFRLVGGQQEYLTGKDRNLKTVSDAMHQYPKKGKSTACVKVVDTFGSDTSITVAVEV